MPARPLPFTRHLLSAIALLAASTAAAAPDPPEAAEDPAPDPVPPAPDQVGGHFLLDVGATWVMPSGSLTDSGVSAPEAGPSVLAFAGFGVTRGLVLGVEGEWLSLGAPAACSACTLDGTSVALLARFVAAQGQRLSPWVGAGLAYRSFELAGAPAAVAGDYTGLEWLHVRAGASWYAFSGFTVTPGLALSAFAPGTRPSTAGPAGTLWLGQLTLAIGLDTPGR